MVNSAVTTTATQSAAWVSTLASEGANMAQGLLEQGETFAYIMYNQLLSTATGVVATLVEEGKDAAVAGMQPGAFRKRKSNLQH